MSAARLSATREDPTARSVATLAALVAGLALAQVHWIGLLAGGAAVALPQRSVPRGLLAGLGFGVVAWITFLASLWTTADAGLYASMGQVALLSAAIPLGLGLLGGLVRAVG